MLVSSKETRRSFLRQFATWSAVAGGSGLGATPIFAADPESLRRPQASGHRDSVEAGSQSHPAAAGGVDFDRRGGDSAARRLPGAARFDCFTTG